MADKLDQYPGGGSINELETIRSGFMEIARTLGDVATIIENLHLATTTDEARAIRMEAAGLIEKAKTGR